MSQALLLFIVPALLALAAGWDLTSYTIPNFLSAALIAAFALFALATHMTLGAVGMHLLAGALGLFAGFALFALGTIGGGDAKLFAAIALWLGFASLLDFTLAASLFGGGLAIAILGLRHVPLPALLSGQGWLVRLHDEKAGIPYGVALAAGALVVLPGSEMYRLVAL
jgi:prepilin peptidase CpaA